MLVPAFLSSGYHVRPTSPRTSRPADIARPCWLRPSARLRQSRASSPSDWSNLAGGLQIRWCWRRRARPIRTRNATRASRLPWCPLRSGNAPNFAYAATGEPNVADAVARLRARGARRSPLPHTCWRTDCFKIDCGRRAPTWSVSRSAPIPVWCGSSPPCSAGPWCRSPPSCRDLRRCCHAASRLMGGFPSRAEWPR